jgi:integrase
VAARRRQHGEGSVFKRADGRWAATVELPRTVSGKRQRKTVYGHTLAEVMQRKREVQVSVVRHIPLPDERRTTGEFLEWWLRELLPGTVRDRTVEGYRGYVERYMKPAFGSVPLVKLGPEHVLAMLRSMEARGLSPTTRTQARAILRRALNQALRWEWVHRNVAALVDSPGTPRPKTDDVLTYDEACRLLAAAKGDRLEALWVLILAVGLRRGEALGVRWDAVDLDKGTLRVEAALDRVKGAGIVRVEPKTDRSRRTVLLPAMVVDALRSHRARQAAERLAACSLWEDHGLVFTTDVGTPIDPANATHRFQSLTARAGLGHRRLHALRHTAATLLLEQGVPLDLIADTLGHASFAFTKDVYAHATPKRRREAALAMDAMFGG